MSLGNCALMVVAVLNTRCFRDPQSDVWRLVGSSLDLCVFCLGFSFHHLLINFVFSPEFTFPLLCRLIDCIEKTALYFVFLLVYFFVEYEVTIFE